MKAYSIKRAALCVALGACLGIMLPGTVMAQTVSGAVAGRATAGDQVTVVSSSTGLTRTVTVGADGSYRLGQLPVGDYQLQLSREGQKLGDQVAVSVAVGGTTTVNLASAGGVTNLDALQVTGTRVINRVDVYSTETSFNINRQEISRLPVAQDLSAVALMAPGVVGGNSSFGGPVLRRFVGGRKRGVHQRSQRHRHVHPARLQHRTVRLLQRIPDQDRRLLGRVRPLHRRCHQRGYPLGQQ